MPAGRRILPQSLSTDPRYARLSLKAKVLYPLLWVNADDQGRLSADPEKVKLAVCASVPEISSEDIPDLIQEMHQSRSPGQPHGLVVYYHTNQKNPVIQIADWWQVERPQWAWPSEYAPPPGWIDHLRYKRGREEVVKVNWPPDSGEHSPEKGPSEAKMPHSPENSPEGSGSLGRLNSIQNQAKRTTKIKRNARNRSTEQLSNQSKGLRGSRAPPK